MRGRNARSGALGANLARLIPVRQSSARRTSVCASGRDCRFGAAAHGVLIGAFSVRFAQVDPAATSQASDTSASPDDIVVTGIRQSLANAQNIKRNSDTVVDAITATDIGALPDRSVTEALQRVPGVSISRFAAANDPDHFSVEGSGVVVRGLNFVRSEFNGRDAFAAGIGGQSLNFSDVPAELLGSVEVYKNATAELIEGGLAGTVNLNTRKPFDNKGFHLGFTAEGNYGDFKKKWSPTGSLFVSDTWDTGIGRFGLLGGAIEVERGAREVAGLGEVVFGKKFLEKVASGAPLEADVAPAAVAPKEPELVKPVKPAKEVEDGAPKATTEFVAFDGLVVFGAA